MKDIAIFGAGGLGKEIACLIDRINYSNGTPLWNIIGFFDDSKNKGELVSHYGVVLGGMNELNDWEHPIAIVIAIGNPVSIKTVADRINNSKVYFPNLIDKSFFIIDKETFKIGHGNIIQGQGSVSCDVEIGNFNLLNGGVVLGHDVNIGNYNTIMPGVRISGQVRIGECNHFGVNAVVLQKIIIGNGVHLGAGSVLMTKPKNNSTYLGVPAKRFKF